MIGTVDSSGMINVWSLSPDDTADAFQTDLRQGLSSLEAGERLTRDGANAISDRKKRKWSTILMDQFRDAMVLILIAAAVISFTLGFPEREFLDTIVILVIVVINAVIGFTQEYRAEETLKALREIAKPNAKVVRDGKVQKISAKDLVLGDLIIVEAGDVISADARLVQVANLRTQESSLTGESEPVEKQVGLIATAHPGPGDQINMLFSGTAVIYGRGNAIVTATGMNTELGKIASLIQGVDNEPTPLQRRMAKLGRTLALIVLGITIVVMVLGALRGEQLIDLFLIAVAMAVAAIPEGLPAIVTISLALGAQRLLKDKSLIRKLPAVETLGSITTICSDKTGTLTQNQMTVHVLDMANQRVEISGHKKNNEQVFEVIGERKPEKISLELLLLAGVLNNDATIEHDSRFPLGYRTLGDPTEAALLVAADLHNLDKELLDEQFPRVAEIPFSSDRKRMTTVHKVTKDAVLAVDPDALTFYKNNLVEYLSFTKGALGEILKLSSGVWVHDHVDPLTGIWHDRIQSAHDRMASQGMRVIGIGLRNLYSKPSDTELDALECDLVFLGIVGIIDPPRPEVKEAVAKAKTAGIRPVIITGDHPITAKEIAKFLKIAEEKDRVVTGQELAEMSSTELEAIVENVPVFARVSPEHKLNIVQALQKKGHIVAMTGDGVNDAPALKKSNIGVAMGVTGTDVSKESAEMVILDDNFATIVTAIEQGRTIYDNVRKFLQYILTSNSGEIIVMLFAPFFGMPLPLIPLQILWINLVTDGLPGLALSVEPSELDVMSRKPFKPDESIFSRGIGQRILWAGLLMGGISLTVGYWGYSQRPADINWWRTLVFNTLTLSQMGNAMAIRSNKESLFKIGLRTNMLMLYAVLLTIALQMAVIYLPFMQNIFATYPLSIPELLLTFGASSLVFIAIEIEKWTKRRKLIL